MGRRIVEICDRCNFEFVKQIKEDCGYAINHGIADCSFDIFFDFGNIEKFNMDLCRKCRYAVYRFIKNEDHA